MKKEETPKSSMNKKSELQTQTKDEKQRASSADPN